MRELQKRLHILLAACPVLILTLLPLQVFAAKIGNNLAFPEKFKLRLASYNVQNADTDLAVFSSAGLGAGVSFADDLNGDETVTTPRIDGYYRFNDRHRIDFATFEFQRDGRKVIEIEIDLEDQTYDVGDTVVTDLDYSLFKVAYSYTLYHSSEIEIGVSAGLHITSYDLEYREANNSNRGSADVRAPLPMFGMRVSYAITPKWSLHYLTEAFYIKVEDTLSGAFTLVELDLEYRLNKSFVLGAGISHFSTDFDADDPNWNGRIIDSHKGLLIYGGYMF